MIEKIARYRFSLITDGKIDQKSRFLVLVRKIVFSRGLGPGIAPHRTHGERRRLAQIILHINT